MYRKMVRYQQHEEAGGMGEVKRFIARRESELSAKWMLSIFGCQLSPGVDSPLVEMCPYGLPSTLDPLHSLKPTCEETFVYPQESLPQGILAQGADNGMACIIRLHSAG
jgi:hypothetical protein